MGIVHKKTSHTLEMDCGAHGCPAKPSPMNASNPTKSSPSSKASKPSASKPSAPKRPAPTAPKAPKAKLGKTNVMPSSNPNQIMNKLIKVTNDLIKEQNKCIAKYVKAQEEKERCRVAQFEAHANFLQEMVEALTEDNTSLIAGKPLVDKEKRDRCTRKVEAYRLAVERKEAKQSAEEEEFKLEPMPLIDLFASYDDDVDEDVDEDDLFGDDD